MHAVRPTDELKSIGLKATFPRTKILELFDKAEGKHLTADDVYRLLLGDSMDVGLATVYRALTQFEQAGLIERHHFESGKAVFERKAMQHHDHLVCTRCGHVEEFHDEEIERRQRRIAKERGFVIQAHTMYLYVECKRADCPNKDNPMAVTNIDG
jgi:Fur family ferric uptake transcriptional regulator